MAKKVKLYARTKSWCKNGGIDSINCILKSKQSIGAPTIYEKKKDEKIKLTDRQKEILSIIKENRQATLPKIVNALTHKAARRTIQRELARLKDLGLISLRGGTKGSTWEIIAP